MLVIIARNADMDGDVMSYETDLSKALAANKRFYLPVGECSRGHLAVHRTRDNQCLDCLSEDQVKEKMQRLSLALDRELYNFMGFGASELGQCRI